MHLLKAMPKHWAIDFIKQPLIDPDFVLRSDPEKVSVECRMVDLAERQSVRHHGIATILTVTSDVRGVEQFDVSQTAYSAA